MTTTDTTTTTFRLVRVVGDRPANWPDGVILNAPRPLLGTEVTGPLRGFSVVVEPDRYRRDETLDSNLRNDAQAIEFIPRSAALDQVRQYATDEYGADALDGIDDDELLDIWQAKFAAGTVDVA